MAGDGDWIVKAVRTHVDAGKTELPIFDGTAMRVQAMLQEQEFDVQEAERLIGSDPTLATELLRAANSSYYRGIEKTLSVHDAVMRLGAKEVANLVLLIGHKQSYTLVDAELKQYIEGLWRHAVAAAVGSHWLSTKLRRPDIAPQAFLGGLLHDVGKLFVLRVLDEIRHPKREALKAAAPELMASLHTEEGARLLEKWNLPDVFCGITRRHHDDYFDEDDQLCTTVRLVDRVCNHKGIGIQAGAEDPVDCQEARLLGVPEKGVEALGHCVEQALEIATV